MKKWRIDATCTKRAIARVRIPTSTMKRASPPDTIALMTTVVARRWLFVRWKKEVWQSFERRQGLAEYRTRFVAFPSKMVVVAPDFESFDARFDQTFAYVPMRDVTASERRRITWPDEQVAFFQRCLTTITSRRAHAGERAEVAYIAGSFLADDGRRWTAPFDAIEQQLEVISRETCIDRILPALSAGIGPEEGGLYAPYGGDGVFLLASI